MTISKDGSLACCELEAPRPSKQRAIAKIKQGSIRFIMFFPIASVLSFTDKAMNLKPFSRKTAFHKWTDGISPLSHWKADFIHL